MEARRSGCGGEDGTVRWRGVGWRRWQSTRHRCRAENTIYGMCPSHTLILFTTVDEDHITAANRDYLRGFLNFAFSSQQSDLAVCQFTRGYHAVLALTFQILVVL